MTLCLFKKNSFPPWNKCVKEGKKTNFVVCDWAFDDRRLIGLCVLNE